MQTAGIRLIRSARGAISETHRSHPLLDVSEAVMTNAHVQTPLDGRFRGCDGKRTHRPSQTQLGTDRAKSWRSIHRLPASGHPLPTSSVEVGTHPEIVLVWQRPVAERHAPQRSQRLSLSKIGHLDSRFEESPSSVDLPVRQ